MARQERAVRTRATLVYAAAEVFEESGFSGAPISRIIRRAEATMGALYFHFASKEALARAVLTALKDELELPGGQDGLQRLFDITMYLAGQLQSNVLLRAGVRLAAEQTSFGPLDDTNPYLCWTELFREQLAAAEGDLLPGVDLDDVSLLLVGSCSGAQLLSQFTGAQADLPDRVLKLWRYLLPGIATPQARSALRLSTHPDPARA